MARRYGKTDTNHTEIINALRGVGAQVQSLASVGEGCPDLLVAFRGDWYVFEVKDGDKPPSHRKLTVSEHLWHDRFSQQAPVWTVFDVPSALLAIGAT